MAWRVCSTDLALLVDAPGRTLAGNQNTPPGVADWPPAVVNGVRACVTIGAVELLCIATAWPNGGSAIVFVTIVVLLLAPKGDLAVPQRSCIRADRRHRHRVRRDHRIRGSAGCRNVSGPLRRHGALLQSATHSRSGASAVKLRSTRSGACRPPSLTVVMTNLRRLTPARPACDINRATRLRPI